MAKRDLELALRVKADMEEARAQLQGLGGDVAAIGVDARSSTASMAKLNAAAGSQAATMRAAAMTAGQYQQAMRQLPMQITDITTSLASGMPLWMVAIQQGGQLRDSFGGIGNAGRALMTTLNPLTLAIGAAVAATTGLLLAYQQGGKEGYEFNKAIIMTGNSAGTSADQLANMAARIDGISGTQRQAAAALAEVTNAGKFTAEQIEKIATTAVVMENTIGKALSDTVAEFERLADEPAQAAAELNEQYNFLTAAVYEQIAALEAQGNEAAAAQLAMDALASTMQQRAQEIAGNLGLIESAWKGIKNVAAEAWDEMLGIGRDATLEDQLAEVQRRRNDARYGVRGDRLGTSIDPETAAALDAEEQRLNLQIQQRDQEAAWAAELTKINEESIAAQQELAKIREQSLSKVEQKEKAIAEYRANVEKIRAASPDSSLISEDKIAKDIAAIEARYAERERKARTPKPKVDQELRQQEQYVAQLERQAATLGKNAEEVRQYELAEKGLADALHARAAAALELINQEERKRLADADGKQLSGMQAQLLSSQGQQAAAAAIQIEQQYGELVKRLQERGDAAGLDLVNRFINVEQAKAQLEELQAEVDRIFADQGRREQTINTQQQAGLLSEIGAREEILDLNQATTAQIEQLLPKMRELAAVTGDPAAIERLKDLESRLGTLTIEADQFSRSLKAGFETGIQSALQGLATGTMNLREAALSFINSIANSMATMASQQLAKMATSGLAGLLGGGQDDTNMTAGAAAVTASAGALSVAGSTLVTGAAAIEAAAATLAAANGGGVGGSVVNAGSSSGGSGWLGLITKAASAYFGGGAGGGYTGAYGFAEGGHVRGPGTTTSDSIFAKLSDQEYVVRASVVTQEGMLPLLHDLNARGFAALDDWYGARLAHHSTGGLAGVPAPAMPSPGLGGSRLADPAKSMSATLNNAINLHVYDDPQRIADSAFNSRAGQENFVLMLSRDPARYRSILGIS